MYVYKIVLKYKEFIIVLPIIPPLNKGVCHLYSDITLYINIYYIYRMLVKTAKNRLKTLLFSCFLYFTVSENEYEPKRSVGE